MAFQYTVQRFGDSGVIECGVVDIGSLVEGEAVCSYLQLFPEAVRYDAWVKLGDTPDVGDVLEALPPERIGLPWRLVDTAWGVMMVMSFQRNAPPVGWQRATAAAAGGRFGLPSLPAMEFADGYCYLAGVNQVLRAHAATVFGAYPSVSRLKGYLSPDAMFSRRGGVVHLVRPGRAPPASTAPHNVGRDDNGGPSVVASRQRDMAKGYRLVDTIDAAVSASSRVAVGAVRPALQGKEVLPALVDASGACSECREPVDGVICVGCERVGRSAVAYDAVVSLAPCSRESVVAVGRDDLIASYARSLATYGGLDVPALVNFWGRRPTQLASGCSVWSRQTIEPPDIMRDVCRFQSVHQCCSSDAHLLVRAKWWAIELMPGEQMWNEQVEVLGKRGCTTVVTGIGPQVWSYSGGRACLAVREFTEASYLEFLRVRFDLAPSTRLRVMASLYGLSGIFIPHDAYTDEHPRERAARFDSAYAPVGNQAGTVRTLEARKAGFFGVEGGALACVFDPRGGTVSLDCGLRVRDSYMLGLAPQSPQQGWAAVGRVVPCAATSSLVFAVDSLLEPGGDGGSIASSWLRSLPTTAYLYGVWPHERQGSQLESDLTRLFSVGDDTLILSRAGGSGHDAAGAERHRQAWELVARSRVA